MRTLLKIAVIGLLLVLAVAIGTEVVALHRSAPPVPTAPLLVVRKSQHPGTPAKMVRPLASHPRAGRHTASLHR